MRAILIDSANRQVRSVKLNDTLADLRAAVGGYIEVALRLPHGHVLYVDEEGLLKPTRHFFRWPNVERPFAGNGLIVGPERYDDEGNYRGTEDATLPVALIAKITTFVTRAQVDAWAKATASEPEITFTSIDADGNESTEVIQYRGRVWGDMPRPEEDKTP